MNETDGLWLLVLVGALALDQLIHSLVMRQHESRLTEAETELAFLRDALRTLDKERTD